MIPAGVDFFALADLPNLQCGPLEVIWDGRLLEVARAFIPGSRKLAWWRKADDGELVRLPPAQTTDPWTKEPQAWRPLHPRWTWPDLTPPKPLERHQIPRFTYQKQSFGAVDDAEAAELAREMEADRETARAVKENTDGSKSGESRKLWWLDATQFRYDPAGSISRRDAEARVMRALAQEDFKDEIAMLGLRMPETYRVDPDLAPDLAAAEARNPPSLPPAFRPLPADGDDFLIAMSWYNALGSETGREVLRIASRMEAYTFGEIGDATGKTRAGAQIAYHRAIKQIAAIANGAKTRGVIERDRALAEIRARNTAAKQAAAEPAGRETAAKRILDGLTEAALVAKCQQNHAAHHVRTTLAPGRVKIECMKCGCGWSERRVRVAASEGAAR